MYEWDGADRAEWYARSLWQVLELVSEAGSIDYRVFPASDVTTCSRSRAMRTTEAKAKAECHDLGVFVGCDWAGRAAVSEVDAHQVASGSARSTREHDARWRAFIDASEDWDRQRSDIYRRVFAKVVEAAQRRGRGGPEVNSEASAEAMAAARDFERRRPAPDWNGEKQTVSWLSDGELATAGVA
jgi:hypothetical protein